MSTKATLSRNAPMTFFCAATILAAGVALPGCHSPRGGAMPASFGTHTYESRETSPKTVRLIDIRTDEEIFVMDIPVGKQLTLDFRAGMGDDPVYTPDLMRYQLFDIGTRFGRLRSSMTVPSAQVRRLELEIRPGIEYVEPPPEEMLRVDELRDRPDWWTPRGGRMPDEHPAEIYDK
jgi:hypothetical protein